MSSREMLHDALDAFLGDALAKETANAKAQKMTAQLLADKARQDLEEAKGIKAEIESAKAPLRAQIDDLRLEIGELRQSLKRVEAQRDKTVAALERQGEALREAKARLLPGTV